MTPRLSVILVVLNNRAYIGKAVDNFLSQRCPQAELVIVDGASTDGTREEIERLASLNPSIRWISEPDKGQSDAMNKGIAMAQADYISFLNVDDFYEDGTLNEVVRLISNPSAPDFLVGNCKVWDADGKLIYINRPRKLRPWHILSGYFLPVNPSAYFYRKKLHDSIGLYPLENHMNMDIEFIIKASLHTTLTYFDRDWGNFRMLPDTKTVGEMSSGKLHNRKQALFDRYLSEAPAAVRVLTAWTEQTMALTGWGKKRWKQLAYYPKAALWKMGIRPTGQNSR